MHNPSFRADKVKLLCELFANGDELKAPRRRQLAAEWGVSTRTVQEWTYEAKRTVGYGLDREAWKDRLTDIVDDATEAAQEIEEPHLRSAALIKVVDTAAKLHGANEPDRVQQETIQVQVEMQLRGFLEKCQQRLSPEVFAAVLAIAMEQPARLPE